MASASTPGEIRRKRAVITASWMSWMLEAWAAAALEAEFTEVNLSEGLAHAETVEALERESLAAVHQLQSEARSEKTRLLAQGQLALAQAGALRSVFTTKSLRAPAVGSTWPAKPLRTSRSSASSSTPWTPGCPTSSIWMSYSTS